MSILSKLKTGRKLFRGIKNDLPQITNVYCMFHKAWINEISYVYGYALRDYFRTRFVSMYHEAMSASLTDGKLIG